MSEFQQAGVDSSLLPHHLQVRDMGTNISGREQFIYILFDINDNFVFRLTGETVVTAFDLDRMYTPFFFARVKSYTAYSEQPL